MDPSVIVWVSKLQQDLIYEWSVSLSFHFPCPFLESMKEIKAVSGDLLGPAGATFPFPPSPFCRQFASTHHTNTLCQMGRIWVDSPTCDTRLLHTTPQQARGVWSDNPALSRRGEESKLSAAVQIYQLTHSSSEEQAQREGVL